MKRHLTEHLADLAEPALGEAIASGEGFELIVSGAAVNWQQVAAPCQEGEHFVWELAQVGGLLRAKSALRIDPAHRAAVYHVELTNSASQACTVEGIYPQVLRFPRMNGPWRTLTAGGGTSENFYPPRAYRTRERVVFGGEVRIESSPRGRSSDRHLPLMLAAAGEAPDAPGVFAGLEYSGEWLLTLRHVGDGPFLRGLMKMADVTLAAGETLILPAVHVGFFAGGLEGGTNALRRYVRECIVPLESGRPAGRRAIVPPVSYDHWFGLGDRVSEESLGPQVVRAAELGAEYWVHDAGWFEGGFPAGVGNWHRADPARYPKGLAPLADLVRSRGMRFGLWFEIERAEPGTWAAEDFPQLFFPAQPNWPGNSRLLDLAGADAQEWAVQTLSRWIGELGVEWLRLDSNIEPAAYFRAADPSGKIQLAYYRGLYRVLDSLLGAHPLLRIEGCASGGRRIDLATLRRSATMWISDQSFSPDICRYMQCRLGRFLPGVCANTAVSVHRQRGYSFGDVDVFSRMCGALSFNGDVASWPAPLARRMAACVEAYKRIRHLLVEDFYQLLPTPSSDRDWDAVQFASADGSQSVIFAFCTGGDQGRLVLRPRRINPQASYSIRDLTGRARPQAVTGGDLIRRGLPVLLKPHSAACIHLTRQSPGHS